MQAGNDVDFIRHHEAGIEPYTELTNELCAPRRPLFASMRSMKARVQNSAMVPSASIISSRLMPMPLSSMVSWRFSSSSDRTMALSASFASEPGVAIASQRSFSQASAAARDQLTQEDVLVGINRVNHHVQKTGHVRFGKRDSQLAFPRR